MSQDGNIPDNRHFVEKYEKLIPQYILYTGFPEALGTGVQHKAHIPAQAGKRCLIAVPRLSICIFVF